MQDDQVLCWEQRVTIPTYRIGEPDKNPMFLEKRVYQGSSGVVYPYPVIDRVFDERVDQAYTAVFLENRYLKLMILPQLGGRLQMALDKTNDYHFVYFNQVIKPALVGLAGPWISGGIEFNWPQHHRPTTFSPVDWTIVANADGSKTVWCAEIEPMFRTKGMHGFTLHPERAYFELHGQLYNRTAEPQTFLWWSNPAVAVNDDYQSIFPPDVHAVMDHGKRDVSDFPIATGTYYKVDYSPGTDISRYKNIPVPTSYMVYHSDYDFVGCYDHGREAGMMHVANHHEVPGKKQWTWGNGEFGQRWDGHLTDEDGPYIELMCGAFTDNQPDFSWLQPGEEKRFTQVFMPYQQIGGAKNASRDVIINLDVKDGEAQLGVYVSAPRDVTVNLSADGQTFFAEQHLLAPQTPLLRQIALPRGTAAEAITAKVLTGSTELLSYTPLPAEQPEMPQPATAAPAPQDIVGNEELFLHGLHLEQYRHATFAPEPYYEEALRRDPGDSRCNNAMGLLLYRRGKFVEAESYFRRAVERLILRNPNPYDGEPYYNLGLALKMQGCEEAAYDAFYKATWNAAWQPAASFELARLASKAGRPDEALGLLEEALATNGRLHQARHLQAALLRHADRFTEAKAVVKESLRIDVMEYGALWERSLLDGRDARTKGMRRDENTRIELALDYAHAGLYDDAAAVLRSISAPQPMVKYTLGWVLAQAGQTVAARVAFREAEALPPDYCFPNRIEDVLSLTMAMAYNPEDARAPYYLGNFWYAHRRYDEAIAAWEQSRALHDQFAIVHRNLGLAYYNKRAQPDQAIASIEKAFALAPQDARVLFELDQLYKKVNRSPQERLDFLENHLDLVALRDDLMIERITLLNLLQRPDEALDLLMGRNFHPWEGGEGRVTRQYASSQVELARRALAGGQYEVATRHLEAAQTYPHNLGEGKLVGAQENNIFYYMGRAYKGLGDEEQATYWFRRAAVGLSEPSSAMFYNDQPPDMIFYQGLARQQLGQESEADAIFARLVAYGREHMDDEVAVDYFAISLPNFLVFDEDLNARNRAHCHYMIALGQLGAGNYAEAREHFTAVLALDASHQGAVLHQTLLK